MVHEVRLLRAIGADEEELEAERYLVAEARRLRQKQLVCHYQVIRGDPAQAIIEAAGSEVLVVMATHGRSGLTRWALGSVADRVAHGGVAGVLLVRTGSTPVRQPA